MTEEKKSLLWEILLLVAYSTYSIFLALYRIIVPVKPKSLQGEVALVTGAGNDNYLKKSLTAKKKPREFH